MLSRLPTAFRRPVLRFHSSRCLAVSAKPLLLPPEEGANIIRLNKDCGIDLDASVSTLSIIGPSRRGKSVLSGLLAGGDPDLFPQSHSSFRSKTSGTHVVEVAGPGGLPLRIVDTEGLSHVGRSRQSEALVRQLLISTYLTSSHIVWLDNEVLSSSFFNVLWLVYDYVADVLRIKEAAGTRLPRLMYVRTQETDVQRHEYAAEFSDFGAFFETILETHEDAPILRQMFAGIHGHSLPVWAMEDLNHFSDGRFFEDGHTSDFKTGVSSLRGKLLSTETASTEDEDASMAPLLVLSRLDKHLPKIALLEAFDPRDHERNKVSRLRGYLRQSFGTPPDELTSTIDDAIRLANFFDPEDRDVRRLDCQLEKVVRARLEEQCRKMRLEIDVAIDADSEVMEWLQRFKGAANVFEAAADCFTGTRFEEREILYRAIKTWGLDPDVAKAEMYVELEQAEAKFLGRTGLERSKLKSVRLYEGLRWRIDESVMRLRGRVAAELQISENGAASSAWVWRLGEWRGPAPKDGKTKFAKPRDYALQADATSWTLYEEVKKAGGWTGVFRDAGELAEGTGQHLPAPGR